MLRRNLFGLTQILGGQDYRNPIHVKVKCVYSVAVVNRN